MKRSIFQLVIAFCLLVIVAAVYYFWRQEIITTDVRAAELTATLSAGAATSATASMAARELPALTEAETTIDSYMVRPDDIVSFLEHIQSIGGQLGTTVTIASVSSATKPKPHLTLQLKLQGPFDSVLRTIGAIEYSPYDITTTSLSLDSAAKENPDTWLATVTFSVGTTNAKTTTSTTPNNSLSETEQVISSEETQQENLEGVTESASSTTP